MRTFKFYVDGIDAPKEFVVAMKGKNRADAWAKAVMKWGYYQVHYFPVPRRFK